MRCVRAGLCVAVPLAALVSLAGALAAPSSTSLAPGTYVTEGGRGHLTIREDGPGQERFELEYQGINLHECQLEGVVRQGVALLQQDASSEVCRVAFTGVDGGIHVSAEPEQGGCREYCGARAWFPGRYLPQPALCRDLPARQRTFDDHYRAGRYARAWQAIQPVFEACDRLLYLRDDLRLRNDMAVTLHHLQRDRECLDLLRPALEGKPHSEAEFRDAYPPGDAEDLLPVFSAAWHNLALCGAAGGPREGR